MRAQSVLPAGAWTAAAADTVLIDFDRRHRRRIELTTEKGEALLLDLPQAVRLRDGDGLALEDGRIVRVQARPEALLDIHAHDMAGLVRIAWHLGNRHLPVQLLGHHIRIRADHVIAEMVRGLGGHVRELEAPFDPEAGAYAGARGGWGAIITITTTDAPALAKLLTWLSPAFPTGGFAYSHGLEWAVEHGGVTSEAAVLDWLDAVLRHGAGHSDAVVLRHAWRAETGAALAGVAGVAEAAAGGRERRAETLGQGAAFGLAAQVWGAPLLEGLAGPVAYPVAVGVLARAHGVGEDAAALGLLHAFTANVVSAAVRLVPLGQTAGLRVLAALEPVLHAVAGASRDYPLDDIGGACFRSDIAAMRHETQYTRLFRT